MWYVVLAVLAAAVSTFALWPLRPVAARAWTALSGTRTSQGVPPSATAESQPASQTSGEKPAPKTTKPLPRKEVKTVLFILVIAGAFVTTLLYWEPSLPTILGVAGISVLCLWTLQQFVRGYILNLGIDRPTKVLGALTTAVALLIVAPLLLNHYWPSWRETLHAGVKQLRERAWPAERAEAEKAAQQAPAVETPAVPQNTDAAPPLAPKKQEPERAAAQDAKPAEPPVAKPEKLPLVPIRVTELERGRVWRFEIRGPTDIQTVATHVRAASPVTVRLTGGKTYRFKAPGVPRGRVHVTTQYLPSSQSVVTDAEVPGEELPYGITKIFPQDDMVTTVWQEGSGVGPIEVVIEETGESQEAAMARLARMVDSQPVAP